jgi:uncharacterized protein YcbK (DUF882 family)
MIKDGVDITGISPIMKVAIRRTKEIFDKYESDMVLTSGKRSPLANRAAGGIPSSKHLYGWAIDIRTRHLPDPKLIFKEIDQSLHSFGYKTILEKDHIHIEYEVTEHD